MCGEGAQGKGVCGNTGMTTNHTIMQRVNKPEFLTLQHLLNSVCGGTDSPLPIVMSCTRTISGA